MIKKFYFIVILFISSAAFAQKTYIQCGKLIDGISNPLSDIKVMKNVTFVMKEGKIYNQ